MTRRRSRPAGSPARARVPPSATDVIPSSRSRLLRRKAAACARRRDEDHGRGSDVPGDAPHPLTMPPAPQPKRNLHLAGVRSPRCSASRSRALGPPSVRVHARRERACGRPACLTGTFPGTLRAGLRLPAAELQQRRTRYPVLYLLHGMPGSPIGVPRTGRSSPSTPIRRSRAHRLRPFIAVLPAAGHEAWVQRRVGRAVGGRPGRTDDPVGRREPARRSRRPTVA